MKCAVKSCQSKRNDSRRCRISFHKFPKNEILRRKWLVNIGQPDFTPLSGDTICSLHFNKKDFKRTRKATILASEAVPVVVEKDLLQTKVCLQPDEHRLPPQSHMFSRNMVDRGRRANNTLPDVTSPSRNICSLNNKDEDLKRQQNKPTLMPKLVPMISRSEMMFDAATVPSIIQNRVTTADTTTVVRENENQNNRIVMDLIAPPQEDPAQIDNFEKPFVENEKDQQIDENQIEPNMIVSGNTTLSKDVEQILKDLLAEDGYDTNETREAIFEYFSNKQASKPETPISSKEYDCGEIVLENLIPTNTDNIIKENILLKEKIISLNKIIKSLNNDINVLKYKNDNLTKSVGVLHEAKQMQEKELNNYKIGFSNIFTQNQIDFILNNIEKDSNDDKEKEFNWLSPEIFKGITLKYLVNNNFSYLQKHLQYPIPSIKTIIKWIYNLNLKEGILRDVFKFLSIAGELKTDLERCTVLMHGEIETKYLYEYDKTSDEIVGPHNYMQVIIARGLFSSWQQPIFIGFDVNITKTLLNEIINKLLEINYNTVAIVSNFIGSNITLWNELNLSPENNSFFHQNKPEKIYVFSDTIYLLKLLRNSFIDYGAIFENNQFLTKEPLKKIFGSNSKKLATTSDHKCSVDEEIGFAIELFSDATASKLRQINGGSNLADFCDIVNEWFNIMYFKKTEYGKNIENQDLMINKMYDKIKTMRHTNSDMLQAYQTAILISISSLKGLYEDMKKKYNVSYILTSKLNLDPLESVFSEIRNDLEDDKPTPVNAINKIRSIILGKQIQQEIDTNDDNREIFITAEILRIIELDSNIKEEFSCLEDSERISQIPNIDEYLVQWIAWNYKDKYPKLMQKKITSESKTAFSATDWWLTMTGLMEYHFQTIHKPTFERESCTKRLINSIQKKYLDIPTELIEVFVKQRTYSLIKRLNSKLFLNGKRKLNI